MNRYICLGVLVVLLGGCSATINITGTSNYDKNKILVNDNRSPESKNEKRESVFSAVAFIGEDRIQPKAMEVFIANLAEHLNADTNYVIEVDDFLIADYFPSRMRGIEADGLIGHLLVSPKKESDQYYLDRFDLKKNADSIICVFSGTVNNEHTLSVGQEHYKVSLSTVMIRNDPDFRRALSDFISNLAVETYERFKLSGS